MSIWVPSTEHGTPCWHLTSSGKIVRLQCWKWSGEQDTLGIQVIWDIMGQNAKPKQKMTGLTISNRHHCPVFGAGPHSHFDPQIHTGIVKGYSLRYSWTDDANLNKRLSTSEALELLSSCRSLVPGGTGPGMSHIRFIAVLFFSKSSIAIITVNQSCTVLVTLAMDLAARTYESRNLRPFGDVVTTWGHNSIHSSRYIMPLRGWQSIHQILWCEQLKEDPTVGCWPIPTSLWRVYECANLPGS